MRAAGLRACAARLRSAARSVLDMLEHVEHRDQVVAAARGTPSSSGSGASITGWPRRRLAIVARRAVDLDRVDRPKRASIGRLWPVPQPISRIARLVGQADLARDQLGEDVAPGPIPPVAAVELRHPVVDDPLHQLSEHPLR